jgi:hypothetical protein
MAVVGGVVGRYKFARRVDLVVLEPVSLVEKEADVGSFLVSERNAQSTA